MFIHIDMDYYFAQIEEKRHPESQGKVVIVCVYSKKTGDSGVVSTVNYTGRKYGLHSGQPIFQAKKKAPADSLYLPVDHPYYESVSKEIGEIINKYGKSVEQTSIDEWFLEVNEIPEETARAIKSEINEKKGLSCSIGIAESMIGAKMAADRSKPDGLLLLNAINEKEFIEESSLEKVVGIGKKTSVSLNELGVEKVKDLKKIDPVVLVEKFGKKTGAWLVCLAQGRYKNMMKIGEEEQAEVSRMCTLEHPSREMGIILNEINRLEQDNKKYLCDHNKSFKTLVLTFIGQDMKTHSKSLSFRKPKDWREDLTDHKIILIRQFLDGDKQEIRRIGIKFTNFVDLEGQKTLVDEFSNILDEI
jgi:DNA polymerase IV (DinB-like DNA polymerase)